MRVLLVLVMLVGCGGAKPGEPARHAQARERVPPALLPCRTHDDCEVVQMSCCHICNAGAWVVGVNKRSVEQVKMFADSCEAPDPTPLPDPLPAEGVSVSGTSCLDCFTPTAGFCERGQCTWAYLGSDDSGRDVRHPQPNRLHR